MRKITIMAIAIVLVMFWTIPEFASAQPRIIVSGFNIKEGQAFVGKEMTLEVTLENINTESQCAYVITSTVQAGAPFIMTGVDTVQAGDLCMNTSKEISFPLKIDPTASGGFYQLTVTNTYLDFANNKFSSADTLNIFVNGTPDITANIISSNPIDVYPGDKATVTVNFQNIGTFQAQAVTAQMSAAQGSPLSVDWSKSFASLGTLNAKQSITSDFSVDIPKDAVAQSFPLYLSINYLDENLEQKTKNFDFTFNMKKKAMFSADDTGSDQFFAKQSSRVLRLMLRNTGTDTAKNIKAKIQPMFPFSTDGSMRYIQSLDPGQSAPIQFVLTVDKDATVGTYSLDMILDYEDAQGKKLQDTTNVVISVQQKSIFRMIFIDYWYLWVVLVVVLVIIIIRRSRKKKK